MGGGTSHSFDAKPSRKRHAPSLNRLDPLANTLAALTVSKPSGGSGEWPSPSDITVHNRVSLRLSDAGLILRPNSQAQSDSVLLPWLSHREIEKFIIRQPPKGEKDDYDSENSWISDGLPSSSRRRRRGDGR